MIRHWREKLLLPITLANDLKPKEYASLVEGISANSPIEVQAEAIRHYPFNDLASHVLGYVGSGYEANPKGLSGDDLATYEIKGRKGKAGLEKVFDNQLRGVDGGEIWRVNPDGSRYDRIERKVSEKGKNLHISIDADLQKIAEDSIDKMVLSVANSRILPDSDWRKTILRRTNQALIGSNEKKVTAQLLLSAFLDAPFPLDGKQASTVAGFQGTSNDAERLLNILYARGVLSKTNPKVDAFELAPPPRPPGAAVLVDLKSGEILALASKPNYDLSELTPFIPQSVYDRIQRREAWLPRAWHPGYAPASPFKLVTAIAGYRAELLEANATKLCDGIYRGMECHVFPGIHGEMNLKDAISQSCNVYFYRLAEKIGFQNLIDTAKIMGLDANPPIEVPTLKDRPIVPDPDWKRRRIGVRWTLEDTFNISIGQGGLRQSPLQMASMVARIATNRKSFEPTLIHRKDASLPPSPSLGIDKRFLNQIISGMQKATEQGTARRCKINGIAVAGKTGTGQWRNHNMNLNLAWFVGFAPVDKPEVAVATLVEGVIPQDQVQGGLTATPIAKDLLEAYFEKKIPTSLLEKTRKDKKIMVATHSSMLPIGTKAPTFKLEDVSSEQVIELQENSDTQGHLIAFICNHCPFVIHLLDHLPRQLNKIKDEGIEVFAISSNDIGKYPQDGPEKMKELAQQYGFEFPYLYDETQKVAVSFSAACTPDFFLFNKKLELFYRGRYDPSRPGSEDPVTGTDLLHAIRLLQNGDSPPEKQLPSIGCNIKWKPGQEPYYFKG